MKNFIFKSDNGLTKNSSIRIDKLDILQKNVLYCTHRLDAIESSIKDINNKLERLLIDKHLQMQVDEYFEDNKQHPEDVADLD